MEVIFICTSPLKGFKNGLNDNGKDNLIITSYKVHHIEFHSYRQIKCFDSFVSPSATKVLRDFVEIPCGKCLECRLNYSKQWANRMMLEAQDYESNYFLTLTYDNEHLHFNELGLSTLCKKDFQDFMKRLRYKIFPKTVRFFSCGEYGDHTFRPHYHAIMFGLEIPDLEYFGQSSGYPVFISDWLTSIWKQGHVLISKVSWDTCAYTARYVVKKANRYTKDAFHFANVEPEFCLMSRNPGIAKKYFDEHYEAIYSSDQIIFSTPSGGKKCKPPKYFDKCLERLDEEWYKIIKCHRKHISEVSRNTLLYTSKLTYEEILERRDSALRERTKVLKRML